MNSNPNQWNGYTLDELRFRRLLTLTRIELEKSQFKSQMETSKTALGRPASIVKKMTGALDYFDYGVLAFRLGRRVIKLFRRNK